MRSRLLLIFLGLTALGVVCVLYGVGSSGTEVALSNDAMATIIGGWNRFFGATGALGFGIGVAIVITAACLLPAAGALAVGVAATSAAGALCGAIAGGATVAAGGWALMDRAGHLR